MYIGGRWCWFSVLRRVWVKVSYLPRPLRANVAVGPARRANTFEVDAARDKVQGLDRIAGSRWVGPHLTRAGLGEDILLDWHGCCVHKTVQLLKAV